MTARLTESAIQAIREAAHMPETLVYLHSDSERAWFGCPTARIPVVWYDLMQWRQDGRPYEIQYGLW